MISDILQTIFFLINEVFGEFVPLYFAGLLLGGIIFAVIYQMTKV